MPQDPASSEALSAHLVDLLEGCAEQRRSALQELYRLTSPQLFAILVRILRRRDWAEDALQDAFMSVWRNARSYTAEKGSPMAWLVSICRNRALDILRHERRQIPLTGLENGGEFDWEEILGHTEDETVFSTNELRALNRCLARLSEEQRRALKLAYVEGATHDEIAKSLSTPIGTVKSWIRRGLLGLRQCLATT